MKLIYVNSFNLLLLSFATSDIIINLIKAVKYLVEVVFVPNIGKKIKDNKSLKIPNE
jgi:hypothetical protein